VVAEKRGESPKKARRSPNFSGETSKLVKKPQNSKWSTEKQGRNSEKGKEISKLYRETFKHME